MSDVETGGCQCGAVRYAIERTAILTLYCCHCRECQRQSASGFGMSMKVSRGGFRVEQGRLSLWERRTDRGSITRMHFCPNCGVRICHDSGADSAMVSLKAGSLDDTGWLRPVGHIWAKRAQKWLALAPNLLIYDAQPESYDALIGAYRAQTAAEKSAT